MPKTEDRGRSKKRARSTGEEQDATISTETATVGQQTSGIANKIVRSQKYAKLKHKKNKAKKAQREKQQKAAAKAAELGLEGPPKKIPKTLENTREPDETVVAPVDEEVKADLDQDEFASYFKQERAPKVMLTSCYKPTGAMYMFMADLIEMLPNATFHKRRGYPLKKIVEYATARDFTDIMVFNEDRKQINGLLLIHLPDGPTAHFRLSNLRLSKDIRGHGRPTGHKPELILNNFSTRLGTRLGRMLASLFPASPQFRGRQVVTFHNQRDFIFVRHHRYIFEEKEQKVAGKPVRMKRVRAGLQELGPRFTLKLLSLQRGTFDSKTGEFEYVPKAHANTSRRRFFL